MEKKETDWINFRQLRKGEIIEKDDEVLCESKIGWVTTNESCVGTQAPDPMQPAHRIYRRRISDSSDILFNQLKKEIVEYCFNNNNSTLEQEIQYHIKQYKKYNNNQKSK